MTPTGSGRRRAGRRAGLLQELGLALLTVFVPVLLPISPVRAATPLPAGDGGGPADPCARASLHAYEALPAAVYADRPDSLLDLVNVWAGACGRREEIVRIRILGSIWDGGFAEDLYDARIIDDLLEFEAAGVVDPGGGPDDPTLQAREAFATFTASFADQLLPHVPGDSPQAFFCLFYSGRTDAAWDLLRGQALAGTDLRRHYDQAVGDADGGGQAYAAASAGIWSPFGKYAFAGDHALTGLQYGLQGRRWFLRGVGEVRLGRTSRPYRVDQDGVRGMSDRFDALLLGFEVGRSVAGIGDHGVNVFLGAGLDVVQPLQEQDVLLQAPLLCAGAGYRFGPRGGSPWFLSLDYRREWIGSRNAGATHIFGDAWSLRAGLGWIFGVRDRDRLRRLQG